MSNYNPSGGGLQYRGTRATAPPNCTFNTIDPTIYDRNNVSLNDFWLNTTNNKVWVLVSLANSQAIWVDITAGGSSPGVFTLSDDGNTPISPNGAGNIQILGDDAIDVTGNQGSNSLTISILTASTSNRGATTLATNALTINGTDGTHAVTPASLTAKLGVQTLNGVAYGQGTTAAVAWTPVSSTGGQVLIANNAHVPAFGSVTSPNGTIAVGYNNGTNSITLDVGGGSDNTVTTTDATPTTLAFFTLAASEAVTFYADVVGAKADYSAAIGGNAEATARTAGGAAVMVGAPVINLNTDSGGSPDFNMVVSGNNLILQVTGEVATTYNWKAIIRTVTT